MSSFSQGVVSRNSHCTHVLNWAENQSGLTIDTIFSQTITFAPFELETISHVFQDKSNFQEVIVFLTRIYPIF